MNSAIVEDKEEIPVKPADHNSNSEEALVEKVKRENQKIPELLPDQNQTDQFDEKILLLEIQRQLAERDQYLRAKDIQLQEMEERILMYSQSTAYRLGLTLTWPLRSIKRLFGDRRSL